ncbi:MAG: cytidylate kinase-like family protein [Planctomycetales bacterium]|nr:cytidylate kinase-like family protein [Planctomycetales bacterium]
MSHDQQQTTETGEHQNLVRRRLERWLLSEELRDYMHNAEDVRRRPDRTGPYVAVSREAGAGGSHVARIVGKLLNWDVLDKELLDFMTQRYSMPRERLDSVDESQSNWFHDIFGGWFNAHAVGADDYVFHLEKIIYLAAIHGRVVFVGRGAHCLLPRESGLSVRIVAPLEWRIHNFAQRMHLDEKEAKHRLEAIDNGRSELCKFYFQSEACDPHHFDLVLNAERFSDEALARMIVSAYRERFASSA